MNDEIQDYWERLLAAGVPEREAARACIYAEHKGIEALSVGCVMFAEPSCGNWNCLNPDHQVLEPV